MKNFLFLFTFLLLYSCGTHYRETRFRDKYMFSVELGKSDFTENISYTEEMGLIIIPVIIEGETYDFLFDTGAVTSVSPELKKYLVSIEDKARYSITDALGKENEANFYTLPKVTIGDIDFLTVGVNVHDLSAFQERCISIDGIIGANLMRTAFWKIDFINNTISFSDHKENIQISNPETNISFRESFGGNPRSQLKWAQRDFWTTWDTGYNNLIQISDSLFFKGEKHKKMPLVSGQGIAMATLYADNNEINKQFTALLDSLFFCREVVKNRKCTPNLLLYNQQVQIVPYPAGSLLGTKFMETAEEILFDWESHQISLKRNPTSNPQLTFGFAPFKIGNVVRVVSIWDNSEAKKQGIRVGDTITSLNNQNIRDITLLQWCRKFKKLQEKESSKIILNIRRGDTVKSYSLQRTKLFPATN